MLHSWSTNSLLKWLYQYINSIYNRILHFDRGLYYKYTLWQKRTEEVEAVFFHPDQCMETFLRVQPNNLHNQKVRPACMWPLRQNPGGKKVQLVKPVWVWAQGNKWRRRRWAYQHFFMWDIKGTNGRFGKCAYSCQELDEKIFFPMFC